MENTVDIKANGKLLLSGEYLVLAGARALAFPVTFGQNLKATILNKPIIEWISSDTSGIWFQAEFTLPDLHLKTNSPDIAGFAQKLLLALKSLQPGFLDGSKGYQLKFDLNYPREWGLGSSSSLIYLMAKLAEVDEYSLHRLISNGSGYDIACASRSQPFFYTLQNNSFTVENTSIGRAIQEHCCFAYLGKKQDTKVEIDRFLSHSGIFLSEIKNINQLGEAISKEDDELQLCFLVKEHERIMAEILQKELLAKQFPGFPGAVKSLGAWGGDFAMFVSSYPLIRIKEILKDFGLQTIFTFEELKIGGVKGEG